MAQVTPSGEKPEFAKAWRAEIEAWAGSYAARLTQGLGQAGVAIGGSIARGQHWQHSDLEIGVLVETADPTVTHFNTDQGRGVEIFQLERDRLETEMAQVEAGDITPLIGWPLQLWRCRVTHDPSGLLGRFASQFDRQLFAPAVIELKLQAHDEAFTNALTKAQALLAEAKPRAALTMARVAMNERILSLHWRHGELPRSQSRTDSRFRLLADQHGLHDDYRLFRDIFALDHAATAITHAWPHCKDQVLTLTELWEGQNSRQFFELAVDSNFTWGENGGIICVYRMYVPLMGSPTAGILDLLDDHTWRSANQPLVTFLGLNDATADTVPMLLNRLAEAGINSARKR